ncbi:MAG: HAMP domain-containing histidine kinase, partial [Myxococcota bacterium]|nr:HAMP domain-containing histidine kinase [Myxococcota bacterium]
LRVEREEHARALAALLGLERDATDDGLLVERARADEIVATRDDFLGIVSHDLRNILGNIAMGAAVLAQSATAGGPPHQATIAIAERIQRGTARMNRLLGDLLDVVALEAGALPIHRRPHDASLTGKEAVEAHQLSFAAKGVALESQIAAGSIVAEFDHDRILQVLANLLSNALKFTERGGRVSLALVGSGSDIQFSVGDTGVGIPADQATAIFERFGQVRRDRRGHGLGLYISKCIVEAHGGKIWVDSPGAGGATLRFTLPKAGAPAS